jgi:broad specificity phosphatase PhoE
MTAQCLAEASGATIVLDPGLQERNLGALRGLPYASLTPDILTPGYEPPDGERWEAFCARIDRAWANVVARAKATDGHLAVITHGLVCRAIAERHLTLPAGVTTTGWRNAAVTVIDAAPPWIVRLLNCTRHLDAP